MVAVRFGTHATLAPVGRHVGSGSQASYGCSRENVSLCIHWQSHFGASRGRLSSTIGNPERLSSCGHLNCSSQLTESVGIPTEEYKEQLNSMGGIVTDASVPEGHKGLHGFLYGDAGADVHDAGMKGYKFRPGEDDGTQIVPLQDWVSKRENEKPAGVYAVYDASSTLQYVGYSRSVVLALKSHQQRLGKGRCASVRVRVRTEGRMRTRAALEAERQEWLQALGDMVPVGNGEERELWSGERDGGGDITALMSEAERHEYEEKKLKMRKAMGENLYDDVAGEDASAKERRLALLRATEGDDWSAVIDGQTKATVAQPQAPTAPPAPSEAPPSQIVSPFLRPGAPVVDPEGPRPEPLALSIANVDAALEEVRPYLIADGGNVEVIGIEDGIVAVRLQGACGTCPSSTATMKMGIERSLRATFGPALVDVVQVDQKNTAASVEAINSHLDILRPAITNYGGKVEVVSVDNLRGKCEIRFAGPPPIGMGIQAAIKDKFPDMKDVKLVDFEVASTI